MLLATAQLACRRLFVIAVCSQDSHGENIILGHSNWVYGQGACGMTTGQSQSVLAIASASHAWSCKSEVSAYQVQVDKFCGPWAQILMQHMPLN